MKLQVIVLFSSGVERTFVEDIAEGTSRQDVENHVRQILDMADNKGFTLTVNSNCIIKGEFIALLDMRIID